MHTSAGICDGRPLPEAGVESDTRVERETRAIALVTEAAGEVCDRSKCEGRQLCHTVRENRNRSVQAIVRDHCNIRKFLNIIFSLNIV